jgi:uncharacterized membrane protein
MSDRVSGRSSRVRVSSRIALALGVLALVAGPTAPIVGAAGVLTITTPYPEVVAEPGSTATFKLTLAASPEATVSLTADGVPSGWNSRFRGNGTVIDSVFVPNSSPTATNVPDAQFSVDVPADATAGINKMTIHADGGSLSQTLVVSVRVESAAAGSVAMTADFPQQKGPSSSTFNFSLTLKNDTPSEGTYTWNAQGPDGWTVTAKSGSSATASNLQVAAGSTGTLAVSVTPDPNATAGDYPIVVTATGGGKTAEADLQVTITGSYALGVSTPDQVLSTTANAGTAKDFVISATNTGTAPVTQVKATASAPTGWTVTFDTPSVDSIPSGTSNNVQNFTAHITPSKDAIAGDYVVTMRVAGVEANGSVDIRVRVETPQFWWIAGVVLLLATFAGLGWVFRTYGRR